MTALFMDGFDHYGTGSISQANMRAGPWAAMSASCGIPSWGAARTGTSCLMFGANEAGFGLNRRVLATPTNHLFVSFGFAVDSLWQFGGGIIEFQDGSANSLGSLWFTSTGALQWVNGSGTVVAQTAGPVIVTENWHFFEMEINLGAGTFTLRVDDAQATGSPILNASGLTAGSIAQFSVLSGNSGTATPPTTYIDDLFVRDSNGTVNNGWLGDRRVATLFANADVAGTQGWTPQFYKHFGVGILQNAYIQSGSSGISNANGCLNTNSAAAALDIGTNDFTLEAFVRFEQLPTSGYQTIFNRWDVSTYAGPANRSYRLILGSQAFNGGNLQFDISTDGTGSTVSTKLQYPWTPVTNTWYHLAICRAAGQLLLFVNGSQLGLPISDSSSYHTGSTALFTLCGETGDSRYSFGGSVNGTSLIGQMDEFRFTNGLSRYTASFTPPTTLFPRGSVADPNWSSVVMLCGFDAGINDESSYGRGITAANSTGSITPSDGASIGNYTSVNKATPDDNTFIQASLTNATNILTMTTQPSNSTTVTVGTKTGGSAAVYTFVTTLSGAAFEVLIDTTAQNTLTNLLNAINAGPGAGTKYGTGTTSNVDVTASSLPAGQIQVTANIAGTSGNSIACSSTSTASWATSTCTGGQNIPGPSSFHVQRPPSNTTVISAMQMNVRALKTDAGTATIQSTFVGPLGGTKVGNTHNLTVSGVFYPDIIETDPDTNGAITPTTVINGSLKINRTA
jgi:hypothetical protein